MKERGIVVETSGNTAKVRLNTKPGCIKCGLCSKASNGYQTLSVITERPLEINQLVTIEINQKALTISSILLYGVPLSGFIAGAIAGYIIGKEILAIICAFGLMIIDFIMVKIIIKRTNLSGKIAKIAEDL